MDAAEAAVADILAARKAKQRKGAKGAKSQQVAPNRAPIAPIVPPARNANGTFAKGRHPDAGFAPGVSGNPAGRPRMASALIKAGEEVDALFPNMPRVDAAALALWRKAMVGDVSAFKEIADRTEGKVAQTVELGNKPGETFEVSAADARDAFAGRIASLAARVAQGGSDSQPE